MRLKHRFDCQCAALPVCSWSAHWMLCFFIFLKMVKGKLTSAEIAKSIHVSKIQQKSLSDIGRVFGHDHPLGHRKFWKLLSALLAFPYRGWRRRPTKTDAVSDEAIRKLAAGLRRTTAEKSATNWVAVEWWMFCATAIEGAISSPDQARMSWPTMRTKLHTARKGNGNFKAWFVFDVWLYFPFLTGRLRQKQLLRRSVGWLIDFIILVM